MVVKNRPICTKKFPFDSEVLRKPMKHFKQGV